MQVYLMRDEVFPVYSWELARSQVLLPGMVGYTEVAMETLDRWARVLKDYQAVQAEIRVLYNQRKANEKRRNQD